MKKPFLALFAVLLVFQSYSALSEDSLLTLNLAIEKTLSSNPELQQFDLKKHQFSGSRELAGLNPALHLGLEVENFAGSGDYSSFDSAETTLALSSVIEMGGKRESRIDLAESRIDRFTLYKKVETVDILSKLTQLFIATIGIKESIHLAEESVELHSRLLRTVRQRVDKGIAQKTDYIRVKSALITEEIKLQSLESSLSINYINLASYWGEKNPDFTSVTGDIYTFNTLQSFSSLFLEIESSPVIQRYASEARLQQAEMQLARTSGNADLSWTIGVRKFQDNDDTALVAGFSMPLFSGKRNQTKIKSRQYELDIVELDKEKKILELHHSLFKAYTHLEQAIKAEERVNKEIIPALNKALSLMLEGYERGRFTYQDVVSAQRELIAAKRVRLENATIAQLNQSIIEQLIAKPLSK